MSDNFELQTWELVWHCLILVIGGLGNLVVCLVILKSPPNFKSTPFNMYLLSLAVADLLLALITLPNYLLSTAVFNHPTGSNGDALCKTLTGYFVPWWLTAASEYSIVALSFERLSSVKASIYVNSMNDSRITSNWRVKLGIFLIWFMAFLVQLPTCVGIVYNSNKPTVGNFCSFFWANSSTAALIDGIVVLFALSIIPLLLFFFAYYQIRSYLRQEEKRFGSRSAARQTNFRGDENFYSGYRYYQCWKIMQQRQRTVRIVLLAMMASFVCWTPNKVMYFLLRYKGAEIIRWNSAGFQVGLLLGFSNSCVNPFLYALQSEEFLEHCKQTFPCLVWRKKDVQKHESPVEDSVNQ